MCKEAPLAAPGPFLLLAAAKHTSGCMGECRPGAITRESYVALLSGLLITEIDKRSDNNSDEKDQALDWVLKK